MITAAATPTPIPAAAPLDSSADIVGCGVEIAVVDVGIEDVVEDVIEGTVDVDVAIDWDV
ncbi:hypothetical protein RRF57_011221 [Xylaria bambusicola]|uniref:Uncharacterized protein n=1 Tax=Xylaria bambusicola TaxID=326684 RepID=A0AAN7V4C7_9PEZI